MSDLLKKIYNDILVYEHDVIEKNKEIDNEIAQLVAPYKNQLSDNNLETLKDLLSMAALSAEQAGFENGVRFFIKILYSLFNH